MSSHFRRRHTRSVLTAALAAAVLGAPFVPGREVSASLLVAPGTGAADLATNSVFVAEPSTPDSAMFMNPAGLVGFERKTLTFSAGTIRADMQVDSDDVGYDKSDTRWALNPSGGFSFPLGPGWRAGFGAYGSIGTTFDFEPEPPAVNTDFVSEVAIGSAPFALAYEATPKLWVGAELIGLVGYLRNRFTLLDPTGAPLPIKYTLRGPGIQSMLGLTWKPTDTYSVGTSVLTPGMVWMDGSTVIGGERRDVDLQLEMPTAIWLGITRHFERGDAALSFRWTDTSVFGSSDIEFAGIALPFVPDAHDEFRIALGGTFHVNERLLLRGGTSYSSRIVGNKGISPLLFDGEDVKLSAGAGYRLGTVTIDGMAGYAFEFSRHVPAPDALILPGAYKGAGLILMLGTTWEL
jgi:long-subunit fatty acid transport protein